MSASEPNSEKQNKRHRGPLIGMVAVVAFALILLAVLSIWVLGSGVEPGADAVVDGRTGEVTPVE